MANTLFTRVRGTSGNQSVQRYADATPGQVGDPLTPLLVAENADTPNNRWPRNRTCQFRGNLYAMAEDGIYRKNDPSVLAGAWTNVETLTDRSTGVGAHARSGIYVVDINGVPNLACYHGTFNSAASRKGHTSPDGSAWAETGTLLGPARIGIIDEIVYRNVIHYISQGGGTPEAGTYDPGSGTFSVVASPFVASKTTQGMCVFNDRLFAVYMIDNATVALAEFTGGVWSLVPSTQITIANNGNSVIAKHALLTDGTNLYAFVPTTTGHGWKCYQYTGALGVPSDISTDVLPVGLLGSDDGGSFGGSSILARCAATLDQNADPTVGALSLWFAANGTLGTTLTQYNWIDNATVITVQDSGGDVADAIPSGQQQGGERIWTAGEMDCVILARSAVLGGVELTLEFSGAVGPADKTFDLYYGTDGEGAFAPATLANPVTGGTAALSGAGAGNDVINIEANPAVVYTVVWNSGADGQSGREQLKPRIRV